jgi:hypothetical protein
MCVPTQAPARCVRVMARHADGTALVRVAEGRAVTGYLVREHGCSIGRYFAVRKVGAEAGYDVLVAHQGYDECGCAGFCYHGRCKHVGMVKALIRAGKL